MNNPTLLKLCRLCLSKNNIFFSIFSPEGLKLQIKEKLASLFDFQITEHFGSYICTACYNIVNDFHNFYKIVISNQTYFTSFLTSIDGDLLKEKQKLVDSPSSPQNYVVSFESIELGNNGNSSDSNTSNPTKKEIPLIKINIKRSSPNKSLIESQMDKTVAEEPLYDCENVANFLDDEYDADSVDPKQVHMIKDEKTEDEQRDVSNCMALKIRKSIDELLPEHLKKRTNKSRSDAQIKEYVSLVCEICTNHKDFQTFKKLQQHFEDAHQIRGYAKCCEKKFYRKDRLMNHIINHINPNAFMCPKCGQKSKSKVLLRIHMKQHLPLDERQFQCDKCSQRFVLRSQLTNHKAKHLTDDQKKFMCDECGKAFALKFVMIKHRLTHSKERNFVCDVCAKSFATKSNLQSHMRHHSEKAPRVQCNYCLKLYKNIDTLRTHMRRHRDSRIYNCSTCEKKCSSKSTLTAHIRYVHLKIRNFECNVCAKRFRRKLELTEHMARHTGEILYKCKHCSKTFASSSNYFTHRKNLHGDVSGKSNMLKDIL